MHIFKRLKTPDSIRFVPKLVSVDSINSTTYLDLCDCISPIITQKRQQMPYISPPCSIPFLLNSKNHSKSPCALPAGQIEVDENQKHGPSTTCLNRFAPHVVCTQCSPWPLILYVDKTNASECSSLLYSKVKTSFSSLYTSARFINRQSEIISNEHRFKRLEHNSPLKSRFLVNKIAAAATTHVGHRGN